MPHAPPLVVVTGTDYTGKSSLLRGLAGELPGWTIVSYDDEFVPERYGFIQRLKGDLVRTIFPGGYSVDMLIGWLHVTQVYLRDACTEARARGPVLVDSYFYKLLAKCVLRGLGEHPVVKSWRAFERPDHVVLLELPRDELVRRAGDLSRLNAFEHHGSAATVETFLSFQEDLQRHLAREVDGIPTTRIDAAVPPEALRARVREVLTALG
jgi:thymidylate kinase